MCLSSGSEEIEAAVLLVHGLHLSCWGLERKAAVKDMSKGRKRTKKGKRNGSVRGIHGAAVRLSTARRRHLVDPDASVARHIVRLRRRREGEEATGSAAGPPLLFALDGKPLSKHAIPVEQCALGRRRSLTAESSC